MSEERYCCMMNTVCVLILNFNQSRFLPYAIESINLQTVKPNQVIFIDDGSEKKDFDDANEIVNNEAIIDVAIFDGKNMGHTCRMNQALSLCSSTYILLLSADDWLEKDALENLLRYGSDSNDVIWGNLNVTDEDGIRVTHVRPRGTWQGKTAQKYNRPGHVFNDLFKVNNFISGGMSLIKVSSVIDHGGWDEDVTTEDLDLWLRLGKDSEFKYVDEIVGNYRKVKGSKSRSDEKKLYDHAKILAKYSNVSRALDFQIAYLIAMRWSLAIMRQKKLPGVKLANLSTICGIKRYQILLMLPLAIARPLIGTALAQLRPVNFRFLLGRLNR